MQHPRPDSDADEMVPSLVNSRRQTRYENKVNADLGEPNRTPTPQKVQKNRVSITLESNSPGQNKNCLNPQHHDQIGHSNRTEREEI